MSFEYKFYETQSGKVIRNAAEWL